MTITLDFLFCFLGTEDFTRVSCMLSMHWSTEPTLVPTIIVQWKKKPERVGRRWGQVQAFRPRLFIRLNLCLVSFHREAQGCLLEVFGSEGAERRWNGSLKRNPILKEAVWRNKHSGWDHTPWISEFVSGGGIRVLFFFCTDSKLGSNQRKGTESVNKSWSLQTSEKKQEAWNTDKCINNLG